jgi:hypothetical protein
VVNNVTGGSFGANLFAPTSGLNNSITNCNFDFPGLSGASPGECIDVENNSADEVSSTTWSNVTATSATFVDFWTTLANYYAHEAQFENCTFTGASPRTFRVIASNRVTAKNFTIGATCHIAITDSAASACQFSNVAGIRLKAQLHNSSNATGTSRAIECTGPVDGLEFDGSLAGAPFNAGVDATTYPITNSRFLGTALGTVSLRAGSADNDFVGCTVGAVTIAGTGSANNRFRSNTTVGAKTFGTVTYSNQIFENDSGTFLPGVTGSGGGAATYTTRVGTWKIVGDVLHYWGHVTWSAMAGGSGYLKIDIAGLPMVPAGTGSDKYPPALTVYGFAFTGSTVAAELSGASDFFAVFGLDNTGVGTSVPGSTEAGTIQFSGSYPIR